MDALFTHHVNMTEKKVTVAQASTMDEAGKRVIARPKNKFRNRTFKMNKRMRSAIKAQYKLRKKLGIESEYFFCMPNESQVDRSWLTKDIWKPALETAGVDYSPLKQARHTYAIMHR